jgi:hypothetical protein
MLMFKLSVKRGLKGVGSKGSDLLIIVESSLLDDSEANGRNESVRPRNVLEFGRNVMAEEKSASAGARR